MLEFLFGIVGGTALLMYGVDLMGEGLENMSSSMMKKILEKAVIPFSGTHIFRVSILTHEV